MISTGLQIPEETEDGLGGGGGGIGTTSGSFFTAEGSKSCSLTKSSLVCSILPLPSRLETKAAGFNLFLDILPPTFACLMALTADSGSMPPPSFTETSWTFNALLPFPSPPPITILMELLLFFVLLLVTPIPPAVLPFSSAALWASGVEAGLMK